MRRVPRFSGGVSHQNIHYSLLASLFTAIAREYLSSLSKGPIGDAVGLLAMAQSYKALKEDFVSNLSGGSASEINWVTGVAPVSLHSPILTLFELTFFFYRLPTCYGQLSSLARASSRDTVRQHILQTSCSTWQHFWSRLRYTRLIPSCSMPCS